MALKQLRAAKVVSKCRTIPNSIPISDFIPASASYKAVWLSFLAVDPGWRPHLPAPSCSAIKTSDVAAPTSLASPHEAEADDDQSDEESQEHEGVVGFDFGAARSISTAREGDQRRGEPSCDHL